MTQPFPEPAGARFPDIGETETVDGVEQPVPAALAVTTLAAVLQEATLAGNADLFPAIVTNADGSEDIALVVTAKDADSGRLAVFIAGVLFNRHGSSPDVLAWADDIKDRVLEALDAEQQVLADQQRDAELHALDTDAVQAEEAEVQPQNLGEALQADQNRATSETYVSDGES
jgi:hypothetical protein